MITPGIAENMQLLWGNPHHHDGSYWAPLLLAGCPEKEAHGAAESPGDPAFPQGLTKISAIKASVDLYATDSDDEEVLIRAMLMTFSFLCSKHPL